jgi:hypothetical protein
LTRASKAKGTHGAAPKALFCVSLRIAENVFVITATNKLMSQMFRTMMQTMKKTQDTKNSASMIEYIIEDHCERNQRDIKMDKESTYAVG